jgi:hypothetical protein
MAIKLENWSVVSPNPYSPPEFGLSFHGNAYGHPRFYDGDPITTSVIVGFEEGVFKTLSGSEYTLGTVDGEYLKQYPDAVERVFASASKLGNR